MDAIDYISEILKMSREETIKNSRAIEGGLTYYWNPVRGGVQLIIDENGDYLGAGSSVNFEQLLEEYKKGERVKNIFAEHEGGAS